MSYIAYRVYGHEPVRKDWPRCSCGQYKDRIDHPQIGAIYVCSETPCEHYQTGAEAIAKAEEWHIDHPGHLPDASRIELEASRLDVVGTPSGREHDVVDIQKSESPSA